MEYYLSIVATSRNDNHGGDLNKRTAEFLNSIYNLSASLKFHIEVVLVEWNPPKDEKLLYEALPQPTPNVPVTLRYVIVPNSYHSRYKTSNTIHLYQMIAKNVGIVRAKGEYVLCTNIDVIFSKELFDILGQKKLKKNTFYRTNRCDIPKDVMLLENFDSKLDFCRKNILRRLGKNQGYEAMFLFPKLTSNIYKFRRTARIINKLLIYIWSKLNNNQFPYFTLDFEACGDFTLMSKNDWLEIQGYVELDMYSIHIDSMALWSCKALDKKQYIFPYDACIYHIDHDNGWESGDVTKTIRFLESKPCLEYSIIHRGGMSLIDKKTNWNLNKPDWGFANENFKEYIFEQGNPMQEIN